jgi:hypothetical protein
MACKTTPEKPPTKSEASIAGKALKTGKATPAQTRTLAGRVLSEKGSVVKTGGQAPESACTVIQNGDTDVDMGTRATF